MTVRASGINPEILRWARERAGYSVEEVARRRNMPEERLREWEEGKSYPTWRQLEDLAQKDYHRGTAFFFSRSPPKESPVSAEFRRLPSSMLDGLLPDTLHAIRQARVRQDDLTLLLGPQGSGESFILHDLHDSVDTNNPIQLSDFVRNRLGVSVEEQKSWSSDDDALQRWRERVEEQGIWVFKRAFKQKDIAGFCLDHPVFPIIYLNNGQAKTRQTFTLFHELAHLLFHFNYLERTDSQHYLNSLVGEDRVVEITCNLFAGEFLVPSPDFDQTVAVKSVDDLTDDYLTSIAKVYHVSREVILRKFRDKDQIV